MGPGPAEIGSRFAAAFERARWSATGAPELLIDAGSIASGGTQRRGRNA